MAAVLASVALLWGYLRLYLAKTMLFCYCSATFHFREPLCRTSSLLVFRRSLTALRQSPTSWTVLSQSPLRHCCRARNKPTTLRLHFGSSKALSPGTRLKSFSRATSLTSRGTSSVCVV